jgi:hypothetical protein
VEQTIAKEMSIEEIARSIQQSHVVGSRAAVSFGDPEHIQMSRKKRRGKSAVLTPQQPKTDLTETKREKPPTQLHPNTGTTKNKTTQYQGTALWDLMPQEPTPLHVAPASSEPPEQLTLF